MLGCSYDKYVSVGEHKILMPPCPKNKEDVLFINEKDAYWRRDLVVEGYKKIWFEFIPYHTLLYQDATLYDQDGILKSLGKDDSDYIIRTYEKEMHRRTHGVHVKIKNKIVWLPGDYWFVLMYCKTKRHDKKDFFDHRKFQLEDAYLCHHTDVSPMIYGLFTSKPKKTGVTNIRWLYLLNRSGRTRNANYGHMNIKQDQGAKTFRDHFIYAYNGLPPVWKAQIKSKSEEEGKVIFGKKYNSSKRSLILNDNQDELNTTVMCVPTKPHAFDVDVFDIIWYDEPPKYESDFGEIYRSNSSGTSIQDIVVGKQWLTSYTPEDSEKSFMSAKELYWDSKLSTVTDRSNGQTKSKLICHHIASYESWSSCFDKYGECDEMKATKAIDFGRSQVKDKPRELLGETRKYAKTDREAWMAGGIGSTFDNARLAELLVDVEEEERNSPIPPYVEGKLEWKNQLWNINPNLRRKGEFCEVVWVPLTEDEIARGAKGRLREYWPLPQQQRNLALRQGRDEWGCLIAPQTYFNVLGADPTQQAAASEVIEGSKNAYYVMSRANEEIDSRYGKVATGIIMYEYFDRPETPDEAFNDLLKLIIYTGSLSAVESNAPYSANRLMEEGLGNYMLVKDENGIMTIWKRHMGLAHEEEKTYKPLRTTATAQNKDTLEAFVRLVKGKITKPPPGSKSYGETIKSSRLLNQLMNLDIENTKVFDLFMAYGWMLLADEVYANILLHGGDNDMGTDEIAAVLRALRPAI